MNINTLWRPPLLVRNAQYAEPFDECQAAATSRTWPILNILLMKQFSYGTKLPEEPQWFARLLTFCFRVLAPPGSLLSYILNECSYWEAL